MNVEDPKTLAAFAQQVQSALDEVVDRTKTDLTSTIDSLDGWTLTIGPIVIPAFPIRLNKPSQ